VSSVDERSELLLADGRLVKIAGIDIPPPEGERAGLAHAAREALSEWLAGHKVTMRPVAPAPDRWNRIVAQVLAPADFGAAGADVPASVAEVLADAGLARVVPLTETRDCDLPWLEAEATARRDVLGLWADPYYAVIEATDSVHLADRAGVFVLVEGKVLRIGHGRARTFVNFGKGRDSFTVIVSKRNKDAVEAGGLSLDGLVGTRLRVRGILDTRFGPRIEIAEPHAIERL
jgi:endonuclease YncB( thermonuclease family)